MDFLSRIRFRFLRVEKDVEHLREDLGEPLKAEKDNVIQRLRSLEAEVLSRRPDAKT